jgi:hypothetical protein
VLVQRWRGGALTGATRVVSRGGGEAVQPLGAHDCAGGPQAGRRRGVDFRGTGTACGSNSRHLGWPPRSSPPRRPRGQCQVLQNGEPSTGCRQVRQHPSSGCTPHVMQANTSSASVLRSSPAWSNRAVRSLLGSTLAAVYSGGLASSDFASAPA